MLPSFVLFFSSSASVCSLRSSSGSASKPDGRRNDRPGNRFVRICPSLDTRSIGPLKKKINCAVNIRGLL
uniref:Putative secreted protein n=1 Tax=Rhipicephalus microplus TaxID=6941 RepID=A0A6G5A2Y5_RHIMP